MGSGLICAWNINDLLFTSFSSIPPRHIQELMHRNRCKKFNRKRSRGAHVHTTLITGTAWFQDFFFFIHFLVIFLLLSNKSLPRCVRIVLSFIRSNRPIFHFVQIVHLLLSSDCHIPCRIKICSCFTTFSLSYHSVCSDCFILCGVQIVPSFSVFRLFHPSLF